jgi:hypothetical protein
VADLEDSNGENSLTASAPNATVFDDGAVDVLKGASGSNWCFANLTGGVLDTINGFDPGESVEELDVLAP